MFIYKYTMIMLWKSCVCILKHLGWNVGAQIVHKAFTKPLTLLIT